MIRYLSGIVRFRDEKSIILDVHGVGYQLFMTGPILASFTEGSLASAWTHLAVRETSLDLYGFGRQEELFFFELLLTVPGIGPKGALGILGLAPIETLGRAINEGDVGYLTKVSGIGRKTAEKIVIELKGKLGNMQKEKTEGKTAQHSVDSDVLEALLSLGYGEREARDAVQALPEDIVGVPKRVAAALKQVGR